MFTDKRQIQTCAVFETILILLGVIILFFYIPHSISGDGADRYEAITQLIEKGEISDMEYSMVGALFSTPFWLLGKFYKTSEWWCSRYNLFLFVCGTIVMYRILKDRFDYAVLRKFFLIVIFGSMFPHHIKNYYGEVFTAIFVTIGILAISIDNSFWGWCSLVIGTINTPASLAGLGFIVIRQSVINRRCRYLSALAIAVGLILCESWIRRGSLLNTGYEGNKGFVAILPYSGRPGFSYPFFFGIMSILFSFGKGIFFFAPGLILPVKAQLCAQYQKIYENYKLWIYFLVGMVIVYSKWWSWYGGWFWGPRFFLFASIPASFALAVGLSDNNKSFIKNLLTLIVLLLSFWVGINGAVFDQRNLSICTDNNYALELLCWYTPEFSVLWRPFIISNRLNFNHVIIVIYCLAVFIYLAIPLLYQLVKEMITKSRGPIALNKNI